MLMRFYPPFLACFVALPSVGALSCQHPPAPEVCFCNPVIAVYLFDIEPLWRFMFLTFLPVRRRLRVRFALPFNDIDIWLLQSKNNNSPKQHQQQKRIIHIDDMLNLRREPIALIHM